MPGLAAEEPAGHGYSRAVLGLLVCHGQGDTKPCLGGAVGRGCPVSCPGCTTLAVTVAPRERLSPAKNGGCPLCFSSSSTAGQGTAGEVPSARRPLRVALGGSTSLCCGPEKVQPPAEQPWGEEFSPGRAALSAGHRGRAALGLLSGCALSHCQQQDGGGDGRIFTY